MWAGIWADKLLIWGKTGISDRPNSQVFPYFQGTVVALIYRTKRPTDTELPNIQAMRIDVQANKQFSNSLELLLTPGQLITFRKISYRIRSDWEEFASSGIEERGL